MKGKFQIDDSFIVYGHDAAVTALYRYLNKDVIDSHRFKPSIASLFNACIYPDEFTSLIHQWQVFRGHSLNHQRGLWANATFS